MSFLKRLLFSALLVPLPGGPALRAAEFEVLDRFSVDGYTVLRGSADITSGSFAVGGSTFAVKSGKIGIGTAAPEALLHISSANAASDQDFVKVTTGTAAGSEVFVLKGNGDLSVAGQIKVGNTAAAVCASNTAGTLRWYDGHISVCNGSAWRQLDNQAPPTISALSPDNGPVSGGTPITITGTGFVPGPEILIDGRTVTDIVVVSVTQITANAPASVTGTGAKAVKLTNPDGQNIAGSFTYNPLPTLSPVSPNNGRVTGGNAITVTGTNFVSGATVKIDNAAASNVTFISAAELHATTPAGSSTGAKGVTVTNPDNGFIVLPGGFTYNPLPTLTSPVSPNNGRSTGGNAITINGSNFVSGAAVTIGGAAVTGLSITAGQITATTPAGSVGAQNVTVTNPDGGSAELAGGFSYNPLPTITEISPASGPQSAVITITGTGFAANPVVAIAGATVISIALDSATQIRVLTHTSTTSGAKNVTVTNVDNGAVTKSSGFTYTVSATGGTEADLGLHRIHKFTGGGTFTPATSGDVEVLMVGGGGAGGGRHGGGGGGGGILSMTGVAVTAGTGYPIVIGPGAPTNVGRTGSKGANGSNTTAFSETALGGGGGGTYCDTLGLAGGSGGGDGHSGCGAAGGGAKTQGNPASHTGTGYGNAGASNLSGGNEASGGGGAGAAGLPSVAEQYGGAGGAGIQINFDGNNYYWGGGGGGGGWEQSGGNGGIGGGGGGGVGYGSAPSVVGTGGGSAINTGQPGVKIPNPTTSGNPAGGAGGVNTGGGGGGSGQADWNTMNGDGGAGGSGIVLIRYRKPYGPTNSPVWVISNGSYINNNAAAPDGTTTAQKQTLTAASWDLYQTFTTATGVAYTISAYVKLGTATNYCVVVNNTQAWNSVARKCFTAADGLNASTWTKISLPFTGPATGGVNLHIGAHSETLTQQTAGTIYTWNWYIAP